MIKSLQEVSQDIAISILGKGGLYTVTDSTSGLDQHLFNNAISLFNHLTSIAGERYFNHAKRVLKFGIVNTPAMGGFACVGNQDIDFIGINYGSISLVSSLFARMLSNELILKEVGEPALEDRAGFASYIPGKADLDTFDSRRPSCAIRTAFAKHLALTALTFIFSHEISHIVKGHLQVISAAEGKSLLFSRLPLTPLEKQAVELDADCGAIEWTLEYTELIRGWREKLNVESDDSLGVSWRAFYEDPLQTIRFTFFASYLTLRVISGNMWHPEFQISIGQPLPPFRMGLLMKLYAEALATHFGASESDARNFVYSWCLEAEKAYADLQEKSGEGQVELKGIDDFFVNVGNYANLVIEVLEKLEDEFRVFALQEKVTLSSSKLRSCDYVVLKGMQSGSTVYAILEAKLRVDATKSVDMQCFIKNEIGISGLPFPLMFLPDFDDDLIVEALTSDGVQWVEMVEGIESLEPIELKQISDQTSFLQFALDFSRCSKLKDDIANFLNCDRCR